MVCGSIAYMKWKDVVGYEGIYMVSRIGEVRRTCNGHLLSISSNARYKKAALYKDGNRKTVTVHRLVCNAFVSNPCMYGVVNHIDGNKHNNCASNLEWVTSSMNMMRAIEHGLCVPQNSAPCGKRGNGNINAKLCDYDIFIIRALHGLMSSTEIASMYDVTRQNIDRIVNNVTWKHVELK